MDYSEQSGTAFDGLPLTPSVPQPHAGDGFSRQLLAAMVALRDGDFTVRMPSDLVGLPGKIADTFNDIVTVSDLRAREAARVSRMVGKEGKLRERMTLAGMTGSREIAERQPRAILLDLGLPQLHGPDVARRIRQQPWGRDALIVAVTGWGQEADRLRSKAAGIDHHLLKPVEPAELRRLLVDAARRPGVLEAT